MYNNENDIEELLQDALQDARDVRPSPELLRVTLAKINTPLPSLRYQKAYFNKTALVLFAAAFILIAGGTGLVALNAIAPGSNNQPVVSMGNPGDTSDAALASDAAAIDSQLSGLSDDSAHTDQALDKYHQSQF
jgi:hypothetical protein